VKKPLTKQAKQCQEQKKEFAGEVSTLCVGYLTSATLHRLLSPSSFISSSSKILVRLLLQNGRKDDDNTIIVIEVKYYIGVIYILNVGTKRVWNPVVGKA